MAMLCKAHRHGATPISDGVCAISSKSGHETLSRNEGNETAEATFEKRANDSALTQ